MSKDLVTIDNPNSGKGQFLDYETDDGQVKTDVGLKDETVWLTQQLMAELFQSSKQNINHHIQSIYEEGELVLEATKNPGCIRKIPLNPPLQKGEAFGMPGLIEMLRLGLFPYGLYCCLSSAV